MGWGPREIEGMGKSEIMSKEDCGNRRVGGLAV